MAACCFSVLGLLWAQGALAIHYAPELRSRSPLAWLAVAWTHPPQKWAVGEIVTNALTLKAQEKDFMIRAESLGIRLYTWSGPDGAALAATVPRPYVVKAAKWMYDLISWLQYVPPYVWHAASRMHYRAWEGFSLEKELFWRLCGMSSSAHRGFSLDSALAYVQRYMNTSCLHLIVSSNLSTPEKAQIQKLRPPFVPSETFQSSEAAPVDTASYREENLWAYPAYVALRVQLPDSWAEKIAFLQAFFSRWMREAPPLRWQGRFWGSETYLLQARLDRRSYDFLQHITQIAPRDTIELTAWKAAYAMERQQLLSFPECHMDAWVPLLLKGKDMALPETLPSEIWTRGWQFKAQGIWLWNGWLSVDVSVSESSDSSVHSVTPTVPISAPDLLWTGQGDPFLNEWASAIQLFWGSGRTTPCELIGYYKHPRDRNKRLKYLHALRRRLINHYHIPPQALRITLRPMPPGFPSKALRLRCASDS
ncbi:MAG: hypothetical protein N2200_06075 [Bacteroidia bacterium]|nr:hypothetical protein [Bacteroidia bacterium]